MIENYIETFALLQELQLLQYFIPYFKMMPKKWTVTCYVQLLNCFSQSMF